MTHRRLSRRALLGALSATAAGVAGCTAPSRAPGPTGTSTDARDISLSADAAWTTYGFDPGHTGHNPDASGVGAGASQVWESFVKGIYTLREPAVAGGRLYVGSKLSMWAFDAATGASAWRTGLGGMAHHFPPTYRDGTLFAVSKESGGVNNGAPGYVHALDPATGARAWRTRLPVTSTVAHDGDRLYVAAKRNDRGFVQALDPATGDPLWRFDVPDAPRSYVTGAPAYADGTLYVAATHLADDGTKTGAVYALDPASGDVAWRVSAASALPVAPVVADGTVHVAARDGTVFTVSADGDRGWAVDAGSEIYTRPTYAAGRLFVLTVNDIVAYGDGGREAWRAASERTQMTGMAVAGDTLYVGGEPLFALDVADGSVRFELLEDVFHATYGAPVAVEDVLYAGICIKDEAGAKYDNYVRAFV